MCVCVGRMIGFLKKGVNNKKKRICKIKSEIKIKRGKFSGGEITIFHAECSHQLVHTTQFNVEY